MDEFNDDIKVFLSSPQSFEPVEKVETVNRITRRKKRVSRSKKLLIKNILIEEDFSKLTTRQQILNKKFKTSVSGLDNISLINSGIDLVAYNINNKTSLESYLKKAKDEVPATLKEKKGPEGGTMVIDSEVRLPKRRKRIEEKNVLGKKYYNTLYEDSLKPTKPINKRHLKITFNRIEAMDGVYTIRLPAIERTNTNDIREEVLGDQKLSEDSCVIRLPYTNKYENETSLCLKLPLAEKSPLEEEVKTLKCLPSPSIDIIVLDNECPIEHTNPNEEEEEESVYSLLNIPTIRALYGSILKTFPALTYEEGPVSITTPEVISEELMAIRFEENLSIEKMDCEGDLDTKAPNKINIDGDCISVHSQAEVNCIVKFSLYLEIIQEYLKIHHCPLVESLITHLQLILQRINDSKCICGIEEDLISLCKEVEKCEDCTGS